MMNNKFFLSYNIFKVEIIIVNFIKFVIKDLFNCEYIIYCSLEILNKRNLEMYILFY